MALHSTETHLALPLKCIRSLRDSEAKSLLQSHSGGSGRDATLGGDVTDVGHIGMVQVALDIAGCDVVLCWGWFN